MKLKVKLKALLVRVYLLSTQFGLNPRTTIRSFFSIPWYLRDLLHFRTTYTGRLELQPYMNDRYEEAGATQSEYFWQDLLVARWIHVANPQRHVDVGSRVDGFVAHVASFREIEVHDIRTITTKIPGVVFKQSDLMSNEPGEFLGGEYCDSLSCLHTIEHFGLGRYGDPIDSIGHEHGISNMASLLQTDGTFYLSTPIGRERVIFNANRVFNPHNIIKLAASNGLALQQLIVISDGRIVKEMAPTPEELCILAESTYNLGIFIFKKL